MADKHAVSSAILQSASDLSVEFLQNALGGPPIRSFTTTRIGTGQVGECHRVELTYDEDEAEAGAPPPVASVVLKIATQDPRGRASGLSLGIYERETRFYAELAPSIRQTADCLARCYHSAFDEATGTFALLLEDAGPDALDGDDIRGATFEQAQAAMRTLGKLHASLMKDPVKASWLVRDQEAIPPVLFRQLFAGFTDRYRERLDPSHYEVCQTLVASFDEYRKMMTEPGASIMGIMHGDYRLDNMLFTPAAGGAEDEWKPMVVDWQLVAAGPLAADIAYFLGCSLKVEDRREWENALLQTYCDGLAEGAGEPVLTLEDCKRELKINAFYGVVMAIVSSIMANRTERGDEMFMTLLSRHCELVKDLGALALLPEPEPEDLTPLQPSPEDEQQHEPGSDKNWNESWYFDFVDEAQGVAGWVRLGLTPNLRGNWYHVVFTRAGHPTIIVSDFKAPATENLRLKTANIEATHEVVEPLGLFRLNVDAKGPAFVHDEDALHGQGTPSGVRMALTYRTAGVPYRYRIATRYEIPCTVSGEIIVNEGTTIKLRDVPGQRDHSFGSRDWWGMDWKWMGFHLDNGLHVHLTDLRLPHMPPIAIGYVQREGTINEVTAVECHETFGDNGFARDMEMVIKTGVGGSERALAATVKLKAYSPMHLVCDDGRVSLFVRAWGEVSMADGSRGVGWFEWNKNLDK